MTCIGVGQFQVQTFGTLNNNGLKTTMQLLPYFRDHQVGFGSRLFIRLPSYDDVTYPLPSLGIR